MKLVLGKWARRSRRFRRRPAGRRHQCHRLPLHPPERPRRHHSARPRRPRRHCAQHPPHGLGPGHRRWPATGHHAEIADVLHFLMDKRMWKSRRLGSMRLPRPLALRSLTAMSAAALLAVLTGCGAGLADTSSTGTLAIHGTVMGGQQPIANSQIYMYSPGLTGSGPSSSGSAATSILTHAVQSDSFGNFNLGGAFTCADVNAQAYMVASGGNPGLAPGTSNAASIMISALGRCGDLYTTQYVEINELTTAAAAWALGAFYASYDHIGGSATNARGLANAFANAALLVDPPHRPDPRRPPPTSAFESRQALRPRQQPHLLRQQCRRRLGPLPGALYRRHTLRRHPALRHPDRRRQRHAQPRQQRHRRLLRHRHRRRLSHAACHTTQRLDNVGHRHRRRAQRAHRPRHRHHRPRLGRGLPRRPQRLHRPGNPAQLHRLRHRPAFRKLRPHHHHRRQCLVHQRRKALPLPHTRQHLALRRQRCRHPRPAHQRLRRLHHGLPRRPLRRYGRQRPRRQLCQLLRLARLLHRHHHRGLRLRQRLLPGGSGRRRPARRLARKLRRRLPHPCFEQRRHPGARQPRGRAQRHRR